MRKTIIVPLFVITVLFFSACMPIQDPGAIQEESALTFMQMAEEAMAQVQGVSATEALVRLEQDPQILLIDVSDAADVLKTGLAAGAVNISLGMLPVRADLELPAEWQYEGLQDHSRPIITLCEGGENAARAAKLLDDMGFTDVVYVEGGMGAWIEAGNPMEDQAQTFMQMVEEAMAQVQGVSPTEALIRLEQAPNTLLIDVSDASDVLKMGLAAGAVNISLGMLPVRADLELPAEWQYAGLQDRSRPIITLCEGGENASRAAKLLDDMGFTDVVYVEGGMGAWIEAGNPMEESEQ